MCSQLRARRDELGGPDRGGGRSQGHRVQVVFPFFPRGSGFEGLRFRVWGLGFRGLGFKVLGFRVQVVFPIGLGSRVWGLGCFSYRFRE